MPSRITASSLALHRACPRAYQLRYEVGVVRRERVPALALGSLVHLGLEAYLLSGSDIDAAMAAMRAADDGHDLLTAELMLEGYHARWAGVGLTAVAVEAEFAAPLVDPASGRRARGVHRAGKIDAIVRDEDGRHWIMEHKTTSAECGPGSDYVERLAVDSQVSHYFRGAEALGYPVVGCVYDILRKPPPRLMATPHDRRRYRADGELYSAQRADDETSDAYRARVLEAMAADPESYYRRVSVVRLDAELAEAGRDDWAQAMAIRAQRKAGYWPRNPDACMRYGRRCEYWPVCSGTTDIGDGDLYELRRPHSELGEARK